MQKTVFIVYLHFNHNYCFVAVRADITQSPKNVATKVRQRVTLTCAFDGVTLKRQWLRLGSKDLNFQITAGEETIEDEFKDRFSLNTDGGQFTLVIKSPVLSDGGTYRCKDVFKAQSQCGEAHVIVFGKPYFPIFH